MFLSEWREFPSVPCLAGNASKLVSFLVGLRTSQHPGRSLPPHSGIINMVMLVMSFTSPLKIHDVSSHNIATQWTFHHHYQEPQICVISGFYHGLNEIFAFLDDRQGRLVVTGVSGKPIALQIGRPICCFPPAVYSFCSFLSVTP